MQIRDVAVTNAKGLHARACAQIVEMSSRFPCSVSIIARGRRVSARSIIAVMLLSVSVGTTVRLEAEGPDEAAAIREIAALFNDGFGERP